MSRGIYPSDMPRRPETWVIPRREEDGTKVPIQKHLLECTQLEAYQKFRKKHPSIKIGQRSFDNLRPKQIRHIKTDNRMVCCCTTCKNFALKLQVFNSELRSHAFDSMTSRDVTAKSLCQKENEVKSACIYNTCEDCGVDPKITTAFKHIFTTEIDVSYQEWRTQKQTFLNKKTKKMQKKHKDQARETL